MSGLGIFEETMIAEVCAVSEFARLLSFSLTLTNLDASEKKKQRKTVPFSWLRVPGSAVLDVT